jgi:hypothetical protein
MSGLLCTLFLWWEWGGPGAAFMAPFAALLAGASWDASRPAWACRAATLVVIAQVLTVLLLVLTWWANPKDSGDASLAMTAPRLGAEGRP